MKDLQQSFQSRFVATANDRLRRALAALPTNAQVVYSELHTLAGEAGIMGYSELSTVASAGEQLAKAWQDAKPTSDQQLRCARVLRSLISMVNELERGTAAPQPASGAAMRSALIVEDSAIIAEELANVLREAGFEAVIASTLDDVVAAARSKRPDIVLVDVNLPGVDLRVLCQRIREHAERAKLLIVSAASDDELHRHAQEVGADGYVGKLGGTARILERVKALLAGGGS